METETNYDDQYNVPEPIQPQFEDYFEILGDTAGGMGKVYFCKDKRSGELYALKKAQPEENKRQLFEQEAAFALELGKHPNIVYTHTVGRKEEEYYIVMELVASKSGQENDRPHGNTLKDEFNRRSEGIAPETGFKWAIAFCEGMAYLNEKGMTAHKDIKPENIFITLDGTLKIGDFGLAGLSAKKAAGTRGYRAPEVKDGNFSVRSDIYAFGIVLYQLFNKGYNPTEPTYYTNAGTRMDDQDAQFPQPQEIRSRYAERIIRKCMALNPAERYGSFKELQADLIQELKKIVPDYEYHAPEDGTLSAEDCFQKALGWGNLKEYDKAISFYTRIINPTASVYFNRGNNYRNLQKYDKAIADYTQALKLGLKKDWAAIAFCNRGEVYYDQKEYQKSILDFNKAIELNSKFIRAYRLRGDARFHRKRYYSAFFDFTAIIELTPKNPQAYFNRGLIHRYLGQFDEALKDLTTAIELDPLDSCAYLQRSDVYFALGEENKAIEDDQLVDLLGPYNAKAYAYYQLIYERDPHLPVAHHTQEQLNRALQEYFRIDVYPKAMYSRGEFYHFQREYDKAIAYYTKAIESNFDNPIVYYDRGQLYLNKKDYDKAIADYTKPIELNSTDATAYKKRGVLYMDLKKYHNALEDYTKAIELDPKDADTYCKKGRIYYYLHEYDKALADYNKAIELDPKHITAYEERADIYSNLKEYDKAILDFIKAIDLKPLKKASHYTSNASTYISFYKDHPQAIACYTKAINIENNNCYTYYHRGRSYEALQDYTQATKDYTKAIELNPQFAKAYTALIALYNRLNKPEEAKKWESLKKKNCPQSDQ